MFMHKMLLLLSEREGAWLHQLTQSRKSRDFREMLLWSKFHQFEAKWATWWLTGTITESSQRDRSKTKRFWTEIYLCHHKSLQEALWTCRRSHLMHRLEASPLRIRSITARWRPSLIMKLLPKRAQVPRNILIEAYLKPTLKHQTLIWVTNSLKLQLAWKTWACSVWRASSIAKRMLTRPPWSRIIRIHFLTHKRAPLRSFQLPSTTTIIIVWLQVCCPSWKTKATRQLRLFASDRTYEPALKATIIRKRLHRRQGQALQPTMWAGGRSMSATRMAKLYSPMVGPATWIKLAMRTSVSSINSLTMPWRITEAVCTRIVTPIFRESQWPIKVSILSSERFKKIRRERKALSWSERTLMRTHRLDRCANQCWQLTNQQEAWLIRLALYSDNDQPSEWTHRLRKCPLCPKESLSWAHWLLISQTSLILPKARAMLNTRER